MNKKAEDIQAEETFNAVEAAEFQSQTTREFLAEETPDSRTPGPVDEHTARVPDQQNRMISQHNLRK
ncbi:hypothetical protein [Paenibacillus tengchongensis]|uniref:hypothetical protein n=1 Tax=Paenibacillus tengchongensis TaxID=2608684 RepID=UPI00124D6EC6|nr:hypothetical protein [Paenibacillus tengchongensis]